MHNGVTERKERKIRDEVCKERERERSRGGGKKERKENTLPRVRVKKETHGRRDLFASSVSRADALEG